MDLVGLPELGMEDVFPHAHSIAHDGCGNYWVVDLSAGSGRWEPVLFVCHDPLVVAYQSGTVEEFLGDVVAMGGADMRSAVDDVHDELTMRIWSSRGGLISRQEALSSGDTSLATFGRGVGPDAVIADLRQATLGDAFPWGRFGPRTEWKRHGAERLWVAYPPPTVWSRITRFFRRET